MSCPIFLFEIKTNFKKLLLEIIRLALFLPLFLNHLCRKSAFQPVRNFFLLTTHQFMLLLHLCSKTIETKRKNSIGVEVRC
jgi:hypothetical protein